MNLVFKVMELVKKSILYLRVYADEFDPSFKLIFFFLTGEVTKSYMWGFAMVERLPK